MPNPWCQLWSVAQSRVIPCLLGWMLLASARAADLPTDAESKRMRGVFMKILAAKTDWIAPAANAESAALVIGIFGKESPPIDPPETRKPIKSWRGIRVVYLGNLEQARQCHILYVAPEEAKSWAESARRLNAPNVLTVSEAPGFTQNGGMIQLSLVQARVGRNGPEYSLEWEIHPLALSQEVFRIDSEILARRRKSATP